MMGRFRVFMGFLAGAVYVLCAHVAGVPRLAVGLGVALAGLWLRGLAAGYLEKGKRLAQDGPYAVFRHPLYTGSFFLALGFAIAGTGTDKEIHGFLVWASFAFLFFWVYPRRIKGEEATLEQYFGDAWRAFAKNNHRFLPRLPPLRRENPDRFSWALYRKNTEYNAALGTLAGLAVLAVKAALKL